MKRLAVALLLAGSPAAYAATPTVSTAGPASALAVTAAGVTFCDTHGAEQWNPATGALSRGTAACAKAAEANTACAGLPVDASVRSPDGSDDDMLDIGAETATLDGRVHDCAADHAAIAVATGSEVTLIDAATARQQKLASSGADSIAVGPGWVTWANGSTLYAARR